MPGNEVGDRVHNFFAQENLSEGQHSSQALDSNWPLLTNNLWTGSQRPVGVVSSNARNCNLQQTDTYRGHTGNPLHGPHGLNFIQSSTRPEFVKNLPQQVNLNGFMYGNQIYQSRQDDATNSDHRNLSARGISSCGLQQASGPENQRNSSVRSEASGSPLSFDFFGGHQQQMNHQQLSLLQNLQRPQSGLNDMQQLQQQVMLMKMQELQRQQQLQQVEGRQQNMINQMPPFAKKPSGNHSLALMNGSLNSDALNYHWTNELNNANWLQRNSPSMQGSANGLVFSPNHSQEQRVVGLVPQQVEQSLYGVPVTGTRGVLNQHSHMTTDKPLVQQMVTFGNSVPSNQFNVYPSQSNAHDEISVAKQRFQTENSFGHASGQTFTAVNIENLHQVNTMQRNTPTQEIRGRQDLDHPEILQDKTEKDSSHNDVALDPTEERILFGSDDNLWAAFGKGGNMGGEGCNTLDGAGFGGFSSIQSGTWSALMQSAVAETSSGDVGLQEEWSGLNYQATEIPIGSQQAIACNDGRKQPTNLADHNLSTTPSFSSGTVPPSTEININKNYQNVLGFQQFGGKFSSESGHRLQETSSQGLNQSSEGGRWTNGVPVQQFVSGSSQIHGNASHSLDTGSIRGVSGSWASENSESRQLSSKPNGWIASRSVTPHEDATFAVHGSGNSFQFSQSNDLKQVMHTEAIHDGTFWKPSPGNDLTAGPMQIKSSPGSSQVSKEAFNAATVQNPNTLMSAERNSQFLPSSHQLNYWKNIDQMVNSKASPMTAGAQHDNRNCSNKEVGLETENSDKQENSNDSYRSNLSHHTSTAGPIENPMSDAGDSRTMSSGKQRPANQIASKNSGPARKFLYHPMGNLDVNQGTPYEVKQPMFLHAMSNLNQSKFSGQAARNSTETGKVNIAQSPDPQQGAKDFQEVQSQSSFPASLVDMSVPLNRSDIDQQNKASQSSQNMLELLHKVDQSRENVSMHVSSSVPNASSEIPRTENSDGSMGRLQRSRSSNSQGFGLQLGPPSQRIPVPNHSLPSQNSLQMVSSLLSGRSLEIEQKSQPQLASQSFFQAMPSSCETSQLELSIERSGVHGQMSSETSNKMAGNISAAVNPGFPRFSDQLQNQEMTLAGKPVSQSPEKLASYSMQKEDIQSRPTENAMPNEAGDTTNVNNPSSVNASHQTVSSEPVPVSQPSSFTGLPLQGSSKLIPNTWNNIAAQQNLFGGQFRRVPSQLPQYQTGANSISYALIQGNQEAKRGGNVPSVFGGSSVNAQGLGSEKEQSMKKHNIDQVSSENSNLIHKTCDSQGKEPTPRTISGGSPANSASTQRDIEAFGRSLRPNNIFQHNYNLLNQMRIMKNAENDPGQRVLKRMKGPDSGPSSPLVTPIVGVSTDQIASTGDARVSFHTTAPGDSALLSFPEPANNTEKCLSSGHGSVASQGALNFGQDVSQNLTNNTGTKVDHSNISTQMASSWFNQYGTLENGQIVPMYGACRMVTSRACEQPFIPGNSTSGLHTLNSMEQLTTANIDTNEVGGMLQCSTPPSVVISSQHLSSNTESQLPMTSKSKKRMSATSELIPWNKEVSLGSRDIQTIRMAEVEWSRAANRLTEKVEEDVDLMEDGQPILRARRRLTLTTQLMQQLLSPPPGGILSMDANLNYESVAYSVCRLALGDACSALSLANGKPGISHEGVNGVLEKVDAQHLSKLLEEFTARARKLEDDFLRMDKRASVLDLIVDCQDLEKFSVINRFAKFHGRGQADYSEAGSSSDAMNSQKPHPQRYVTALPLPRNLPTRVQCHSL